MKNECARLKIYRENANESAFIGMLQAVDVHGNGRSNKAWVGDIEGHDVDLPNLSAVKDWAKMHGFRIEREMT